MARDYKDRGERRPRPRKRSASVGTEKPGRWLLIGGLVFGFLAFLVYLKSTATPDRTKVTEAVMAKAEPASAKGKKNEKGGKVERSVPVEPEFTFYTILPKGEVEVPEHELKTRIREELVGKGKITQYTLQAGAFRNFKDANHLKAELAFMNIASKIETAVVGGNATWYRVRLGPYTQLERVEKHRLQLKKNGIDVIITEVTK
jgi:cell division protein FtsN